MNLETGVIRLSSPSMGAEPWARTGDGKPRVERVVATARAAISRTMNASLNACGEDTATTTPPSRARDRRREAALQLPTGGQSLRLPEAGAYAGQEGRAHGGGLRNGRAQHLDL